MTALDRIAAVLHRARFKGGWDDEDVAAEVLKELGLDAYGERVEQVAMSSEIGHG